MAVKVEPKSPKSAYKRQRTSASWILNTTVNLEGSGISSQPPSLVDSGSEHLSDNMDEPQCSHRKTRAAYLHPPGFKVLISHINNFSDEKAADDFEGLLEDYLEATGDCGWSHKD